MRIFKSGIVLLLLVGGCQLSQPQIQPKQKPDAEMFAPTAMRIHPIFTQVKDWTGDGQPDGIEALVEFQDQFGDPVKTRGRVIFELFDYRRNEPDPRGDRVVNPWVGSLVSAGDQRLHWNRTSRTYSFPLAWDQIRADRTYVLAATFELASGGRFFDRMVLEPVAKEPNLEQPTTAPASNPPARPAQP